MGVVATIGAAVTSVAASVGIGITATALTVGFSTIAAVGAVVGVVGAVTHSKILSTVGMVLGGIGGIGALAAGAGLLGAGGGLLSDAAGATPAAADLAAEGSLGFVDSGGFTGAAVQAGENVAAEGAQAAAGSVPGFVDSGSFAGINGAGEAAAGGGPSISEVAGAGKSALSLMGTRAEPVGQADLPSLGTPPSGAAPNAPPSGAAPVAASTAPPVAPGPGVTAGTPLLAAAKDAAATPTEDPFDMTPAKPAGDSGWGKGILDFMDKHPVAALGALQAGGSLLSGWSNELTPAQIGALNSQAAANDAATALVKQQTANLNMPKAVASSAPVSGQAQLVPINARPQPLPAPGGGFINQPVQSPAVTGMAA